MDGHEVLEDLARLIREESEEDRVPERWAKTAAGTLTPEEEERLRAEAEDSEEIRAAREIFRPLGPDFHDRLIGETRRSGGPRPAPVAERQDVSEVISFPKRSRRRQRWWPPLAAAAAIAVAAVGLLLLRPNEIVPIPKFDLDVRGVPRLRSQSAEAERETLVFGARFRVRLSPEREVSGPVEARFFMARDDEWREWPVEVRTASSGAMQVRQRFEDDLVLDPGNWKLVVAVGRPRALPSSAKIRSRFESGEDVPAQDGWTLLKKPLRVEGPEVEYDGCDAVLGPISRPTCVLTASRTVGLWVKSRPGADFEILAGDRSWKPDEDKPVEGGFRVRLEELDVDEIVVRAVRNGAEVTWELKLAPPRFPDKNEARRLARTQGRDVAWRFLEERLDEDGPPLVAGVLLSTMARLSFPADTEQARDEAERAVRLHRRSQNLSYLVDDLTFLHFLQLYHFGDVDGAGDLLFGETMPEIAPGDNESAYLIAFYRGQWAIDTGDVPAALDELRAAEAHAERFGRWRRLNMVRQLRAHQLRRLGRNDEASDQLASLARQRGDFSNDCDVAKLLNNLAWDRLLVLEARLPAENPLPLLEEALGLGKDCSSEDRINLHLNRALAHLHDGAPERARDEIGRARGVVEQPGPWLLVWSYDIEGRIALAEGHVPQALTHFDSLAELAAAGPWPGVAWRAAMGRAQALETTGEIDAALAELGRAETLLDAESLRAPIDSGRMTSVASREWGTRHYLDVLIGQDRQQEALTVARRARARFFRGLARDARQRDLTAAEKARWTSVVGRYNLLRSELEEGVAQDWELSSARHQAAVDAQREAQGRELGRLLDEAVALLDAQGPSGGEEPPPVRPGEVLLVYHPAPHGWFGFAATAETLDVRRLEELDLSDPKLGERILGPFAEIITRAERVRILPYGALRAVDFHNLTFAGDALVASKPVLYGLDLPAVRPRSGSSALLIEDPTGSLLMAPEEVESVERALARMDGWGVRGLGEDDGDAAVLRDLLRDLLPQVDLLHFAGHADFAGNSLESGLDFDLDDAVQLTIGDILTSPGVPTAVVLSACKTAQTAPGEAPVGLGVAHAFLLAGGQVAIGAVREVDDATTAAFVRHLYASWDGTPENAAPALAAAQLALRREAPDADWASFRLLER